MKKLISLLMVLALTLSCFGVLAEGAKDGKYTASNGVNLTKSTENSVVKPNIRSGPHCSHCSVYKCYFRMISPIDREFISIT